MAARLSPSHLILLAVAYASDSNIPALRALILFSPDSFTPDLILRILLSFLPESLNPDAYIPFLEEASGTTFWKVGSDLQPQESKNSQFDQGSVKDLSDEEAQEKLHKLHLKRLQPKAIKSTQDEVLQSAPDEPLLLFLIQRAHTIEKEAGSLSLVPDLIEPFLERSTYLQTWYLSTILPLLRFDYEYYNDAGPALDLEIFQGFEGAAGVNVLMSRSTVASRESRGDSKTVGRDLRGMVGPWTYGSSLRKRRKLDSRRPLQSKSKTIRRETTYEKEEDNSAKTPAQSNEVELEPDDLLEDWRHTFRWMVTSAVDNFNLAVQIIEGWRGPNDIDLGDLDPNLVSPPNDQIQSQLHLQYCQAALASIYATELDGSDTIQGAHKILTEVAEMVGYPTPAPLGTDVSLLPTLEQQIGEPARPLEQYQQSHLSFNELLNTSQPLTMPTMEALALLDLFIHSSYILNGLGCNWSIAQVAKLCFHADETDLQRLLQKILEHVSTSNQMNEIRWVDVRQELTWLWDWNTTEISKEVVKPSQGLFRHLSRKVLEQDFLKAIGRVGEFDLARQIYLGANQSSSTLALGDVENTVIEVFYSHYDAATNGNKTRGSMKKASNLLSCFHSAFPTSVAFREASALLSATHALSFYTLTLETGKPTSPVQLREFKEPLSIIRIVLSQNPKSYAKLDDLISIAKNLVVASPHAFSYMVAGSPYTHPEIDAANNESARQKHATRLVTGMAIEAALEEDDFETAYSYVVNRLSPGSASPTEQEEDERISDDTLWRAAYQAGRHRTSMPAKAAMHERTRRLEQRMDLLSRALSLAPESALPEVLAAWRRCEEELLTLLQDEADAAAEADEIAEKRLSGMRISGSQELPGTFGGEQPALMQDQPRRKEVGRSNRADGEAPMGLFDVARGAAEAFGRIGQKQQRAAGPPRNREEHTYEDAEDGQERVRKRDMVANAVTGGMARGIGWVLGATPVVDSEKRDSNE